MRKTMAAALAVLALAGPARGERMDRTANLPAEIAQGARDARAEWTAYRKAFDEVERASEALAKGLPGVAREEREVAKARALNTIQANLERVELHLGGFLRNMDGVLCRLEGSVVGDLGTAKEDITALLGEFTSASAEHERTIDSLVQVAEVAGGELDEAQQRRLNEMIAGFRFRQQVQAGLEQSRGRLATMEGSVAAKLGTMRAAVAAVEAMRTEVKGEIALVKVLKGEHILESTFCAIFGCGRGGMVAGPGPGVERPKWLPRALSGQPRAVPVNDTGTDNLDWWRLRKRGGAR